jgi:lipoprotein-anchoring transpeptidase ErfK/SrfK
VVDHARHGTWGSIRAPKSSWAPTSFAAVISRRQASAAGCAAALMALAACGGGSDDTSSGDATAPPEEETEGNGGSSPFEATDPGSAADVALVASAVPDQIQVYATAAEDQPTTLLDNPNENGAPLVFLVEEEQGDWLKVLLPIRPNGSTGFVRAADVTVAENPYSIDIKLSEHRLIVTKGDEVVADEPIGVGTASTPTPGGKYYLKELLQPPDPNGAYGPYAYGLSGFSNVLDEFNGGDGVIGIHGTNEPELIGTDVSHGCIRMSNEAITELAGLLPLGTPVHIES